MFYEYAVAPAIFTNPSNLQSFFECFKNRPYRLISDTPKKWVQDAFHAINQLTHDQCPPVMKKTLKNHLQKLSKTSLCNNRTIEDWKKTDNWVDFVVNEHNKFPFAAILGSESVSKPVRVFSFSDLTFYAPESWELGGQQHIKRDGAMIVETVLPLLKVSKQLFLVDTYFSFTPPSWNRYESLLKGLVEKAHECNFGKGIAKIEIHTSDKQKGVQKSLEFIAKPWLPKGIAIYCYQWPANQMHDRFILTDVGGISFGHGLDDFADDRLEDVLISVLEHQVYKNEKTRLSDKPANPAYFTGIK